MKTIFFIVILFTSQALYGSEQSEQIVSKEKMNQLGVRMHIDGQIVDYINLAYDDFAKDNAYAISKSDSLRKIKYYTFTIEETGESMYIEIHFNHELLKKELHLAFKGGGSRYEIDKKHFAIRDRIRYK